MSGSTPTGPAPSASPPSQPELTRGQRAALWIAGVMVTVAVVATALLAFFPQGVSLPGLTASATPTVTTAAQVSFRATQTTQALQMIQPYAPHGIGPCDTVDPPYSKQNASYWQWDTQPSNVSCDPGGVTQMLGDTFVSFYGLPDGFPNSFTATLTLAFNTNLPSLSGDTCMTYTLIFNAGAQGLTLCEDGMWQSAQYDGVSGYVQLAPGVPVVITMRVDSTGIDFSVNNTQTTPVFAHDAIENILIRTTAYPLVTSVVAVKSFVLTPVV